VTGRPYETDNIVQPIPESASVLAALEASGGLELSDQVREVARLVRTVVPQCTGMSLSLRDERLTITLVATDTQVAVLDAVQYLDGGPCVDALANDDVVRTEDLRGRMDEEAWRVFATAGAAAGVLSTLSFPIRDHEGRVLGGVNLYASTAHAFTGRESTLAQMLGGWASDTMANADLTFATRPAAEQAPEELADRDVVAQAIGMLTVLDHVPPDQARERLTAAAAQAGVRVQDVARTIIAGDGPDRG
jgi:GAF domain-containing protein